MTEGSTKGSNDFNLEALKGLSIERIEGELLSRDFHKFVLGSWHLIEPAKAFVDNWHLKVICDHMQSVAEGKIKKLLINIPPRTSKSTIVSILFPAWLWTRLPGMKILLASYSHSLVENLSRRRRDFILRSEWYMKRWGHLFEFSDTQARKTEYENSKTGAMKAVSVGATVTGFGGDILLWDDILNPEQAASDVERQNCIDWLKATWTSRANDPNTPQIGVMQRLHEMDPTGYYLKQSGWEHLRIPMEFDPEDVTPKTSLGYTDPRSIKGELLDPVRFPQYRIDEMKKDMGSYIWAGQYQQSPAPAEGGLIKKAWIRSYDLNDEGNPRIITKDGAEYNINPMDCIRFFTVDPAVTDKEIGEKKQHDPDYTVISAWCVFQSHLGTLLILLDLFRDRMEGPEILPKLQQMSRLWRPAVIGVESIAYQLNLFQEARRAGLPVREMSNKKDSLYRIDRNKVARILAATPLMEDQRFFIPKHAVYRDELLKELLFFPNAAHDDIVDCVSAACSISQTIRPRVYYSEYAAGIAAKTRHRYDKRDYPADDEDEGPIDPMLEYRPSGDGKNV